MKPFFSTEERRAALIAEIESWRGTRYVRSVGVNAKKGVAADCVSFVAGVMVNTGAIKQFVWPNYVTFGAGKVMLDLLKASLAQIPGLQMIWSSEDGTPVGQYDHGNDLMPGDVIVRTVKGDQHHIGIFVGDKTVWNMMKRGGLITANVEDPMVSNHIESIWRAME